MHREITLRHAIDDDEEFLFAVYSGDRRNEVAAFGWDEVQQRAFLQMQFVVRQRSYEMQFPTAEYYMILLDGTPAGELIVDRGGGQISLTDIAVLQEYRNNGIATYLIRQLQNEAAESRKPMVLCVDKNNATAKKLYEKLGFAITGETDLLFSMKWDPA
jgi:ribosomal protein S18 acetylase RimI-like enzyme